MCFNPYFYKCIMSVTLLTVVMLSGCSPDPQKDIALFQPYIEANIDKQSDDPYISSTVKPESEFYEVLVHLQHGRHDLSRNLLLKMIEQGNPRAKYWYGRQIYPSSIKAQPIAFALIREAAEEGDPYALFTLTPGGNGCQAYFGKRNCPEENFDKAMALFKQRATEGDLQAQYLMLRMYKPDGSRIEHQYYFTTDFENSNYYLDHSDETRAFFIKEIIRFAQAHYYQPLMDYVDLIMPIPEYGQPFKGITPEHHTLAIDLLTIAANHNYLPAIETLIAIKKDSWVTGSWLDQKYLMLGGQGYFFTRSYWFKNDYKPQQQWIFARAYEVFSGRRTYLLNVDYRPVEQEREVLEPKAQALIDSMTPMVYIDEFTPRGDWVD